MFDRDVCSTAVHMSPSPCHIARRSMRARPCMHRSRRDSMRHAHTAASAQSHWSTHQCAVCISGSIHPTAAPCASPSLHTVGMLSSRARPLSARVSSTSRNTSCDRSVLTGQILHARLCFDQGGCIRVIKREKGARGRTFIEGFANGALLGHVEGEVLGP